METTEKQFVHKHLIVRAEVEDTPIDKEKGCDYIKRLVDLIGMKLMPNGGPHADYVTLVGNQGLTVIAIIETSHISLHSWPEKNPGLVQLDVYSCSDYDPRLVFEHLKELKPVKIEYKFLDRENNLKFIDL